MHLENTLDQKINFIFRLIFFWDWLLEILSSIPGYGEES